MTGNKPYFTDNQRERIAESIARIKELADFGVSSSQNQGPLLGVFNGGERVAFSQAVMNHVGDIASILDSNPNNMSDAVSLLRTLERHGIENIDGLVVSLKSYYETDEVKALCAGNDILATTRRRDSGTLGSMNNILEARKRGLNLAIAF